MISTDRVVRTGLFFATSNFFVTTAIGVLLRYNGIAPVAGLTDRYWIHAHSHTGFLGWIFMILSTFCFAFLMPKNANVNKTVYRLIIYFQISVVGMLVTFPFMGYAAPSIVFSTFHMILSIIFAKVFFKYSDKQRWSTKFMKAGLIFMLISSIGPLALGPIIAVDLRESHWYDMAIYFYLHFQYNGWFVLAVFGIVMYLLENFGIDIDTKNIGLLFRLLVASVILTLPLSGLGFSDSISLKVIGLSGAILQLLAGYVFIKLIYGGNYVSKLKENVWVKWFFGLAFVSWFIKIALQFLSVIPFFTSFAYLSRDAIMTYLHLTFLGFTCCFIIGVLIEKQYLNLRSKLLRAALVLFLLGVFTMEFTIGLKSIPQYLNYEFYKSISMIILIESTILSLSVLGILVFGFVLAKKRAQSEISDIYSA